MKESERVTRTCSCVSSKRREDEAKSRAAPPEEETAGAARRRSAGSHRCIVGRVGAGLVGAGAERGT